METQTLGIHQSTYDAVFQHPIARNLQWRDVRSMLNVLGEVSEEHDGKVKILRNGQSLTLQPPQSKDISDVDELMRIRHFLERTGTPSPAAAATGLHLLVVIAHREARIFKNELHGAVPSRIVPHESTASRGSHRYLHNVDNDANGQRKPEAKDFYEAVARALTGAEKILIFGSGTGSSSAMDYLVSSLKQRHPDVAKRVVGSVVVNEQHMSDDQLLAQARAFYAKGASSVAVV